MIKSEDDHLEGFQCSGMPIEPHGWVLVWELINVNNGLENNGDVLVLLPDWGQCEPSEEDKLQGSHQRVLCVWKALYLNHNSDPVSNFADQQHYWQCQLFYLMWRMQATYALT